MNVMSRINTIAARVVGATAATAALVPVHAQDYTAITAVADWSDVATGVLTIFAALALVLVALKGGRKLLSAIGR